MKHSGKFLIAANVVLLLITIYLLTILSNKKAQINTLNKRITTVKEDLSVRQSVVDELKDKITGLKMENRYLEEDVNELSNQLSDLRYEGVPDRFKYMTQVEDVTSEMSKYRQTNTSFCGRIIAALGTSQTKFIYLVQSCTDIQCQCVVYTDKDFNGNIEIGDYVVVDGTVLDNNYLQNFEDEYGIMEKFGAEFFVVFARIETYE